MMTAPVLIVGAGPTGLTAALELSRLGVAARIIERQASPPQTSRAIGVQARTLELLEQRGLADELVRRGNRASGGSIFADGRPILHLDFSQIASHYNFLLLVPQSETERVLGEAVERQGMAIERGVELVGLAQDTLSHGAPPVRAALRHEGGGLELMEASWLISAEGAHSTVRATLDLPFEGKTLDNRYLLADVSCEGDLARDQIQIVSSRDGILAVFPLGGERFRVIASNPPGAPAAGTEPGFEEVQAVYDQRSSIPARFRDLTWSSWFHINSRMVPHLRVGRLLLGGDAAHIHSPAGGQGMNTGIQDMINLAWKLALVIRGQAPLALLDTYEQERLPVMRDVLSKTEGLTDLMGSDNPIVHALLAHLGPWIGGTSLVRENAPARMSQIAINYRHGPLSEQHHAHGGHLHAGDRVPELMVQAEGAGGSGWRDVRLASLVDPSTLTLFVVRTDDSKDQASEFTEAIDKWSHLVRVVELRSPGDGPAREPFASAFGTAAGVFLVRPDGYLGFVAGERTSPSRLAAYLERWFTA